jgi:type IV secretory pathway TraG/TraD family ATPase VirD4
MGWLRGAVGGVKAIHKASSAAGDAAALAAARSRVRPSRRALRSGVLVAGDSPPSGVTSGFYDYRGLALPSQLAELQSGLVPIGGVVHPQSGVQFDGWLDWQQVVRHTVVVGPPGSGKTTCLLVPWIVAALKSGVGVVAVDVKGDLVTEIKRQVAASGRHKLGVPLYRWDIADVTGSRSWNPLDEVTDSQSLTALVTALLGEIDAESRDRYFAERDHRWLRGLLRLTVAASTAPTLKDVFGMLLDHRKIADAVVQYPSAGAEMADLVGFTDSDYSLATSGLANKLAWTAERDAASITASSSFCLDDLFRAPGLCVVGSRLSHGEPAAAAASMFLGLMRIKVFTRFAAGVSPMLWVIDEAAVVASRIELPRLLEIARGAGIGIVLAIQDVTQLGDRDTRTRQLASCHSMIVLNGSSGETADYLAGRLGTHGVNTSSVSVDHRGRSLPSVGREQAPVLGSREIMHPPLGGFGGIVHVPSVDSRPFLVDLPLPGYDNR